MAQELNLQALREQRSVADHKIGAAESIARWLSRDAVFVVSVKRREESKRWLTVTAFDRSQHGGWEWCELTPAFRALEEQHGVLPLDWLLVEGTGFSVVDAIREWLKAVDEEDGAVAVVQSV